MCPFRTLLHIPKIEKHHILLPLIASPQILQSTSREITAPETRVPLNTYELILNSAHHLLRTDPSILVHVISIHPLRLANIPRKVQCLNNSCRRVSWLSHCDLCSFTLAHGVRGNLTKNDKQLSPSTLFAPSLKDIGLSVLYMLFLCREKVVFAPMSKCPFVRVCVCVCVCYLLL